ncbi:hypothetical protein G6F56_003793 [Rhizopus delemar]|nr:hypothetical protein G6F56_003793 [Rhizopus delemar]
MAVVLPVEVYIVDNVWNLSLFGKIDKVAVGKPPSTTAGFYLTFAREEDASKAVEGLNGMKFEGETVRAYFGTTKYCMYYLNHTECPVNGCIYLHDFVADDNAIINPKETPKMSKKNNILAYSACLSKALTKTETPKGRVYMKNSYSAPHTWDPTLKASSQEFKEPTTNKSSKEMEINTPKLSKLATIGRTKSRMKPLMFEKKERRSLPPTVSWAKTQPAIQKKTTTPMNFGPSLFDAVQTVQKPKNALKTKKKAKLKMVRFEEFEEAKKEAKRIEQLSLKDKPLETIKDDQESLSDKLLSDTDQVGKSENSISETNDEMSADKTTELEPTPTETSLNESAIKVCNETVVEEKCEEDKQVHEEEYELSYGIEYEVEYGPEDEGKDKEENGLGYGMKYGVEYGVEYGPDYGSEDEQNDEQEGVSGISCHNKAIPTYGEGFPKREYTKPGLVEGITEIMERDRFSKRPPFCSQNRAPIQSTCLTTTSGLLSSKWFGNNTFDPFGDEDPPMTTQRNSQSNQCTQSNEPTQYRQSDQSTQYLQSIMVDIHDNQMIPFGYRPDYHSGYNKGPSGYHRTPPFVNNFGQPILMRPSESSNISSSSMMNYCIKPHALPMEMYNFQENARFFLPNHFSHPTVQGMNFVYPNYYGMNDAMQARQKNWEPDVRNKTKVSLKEYFQQTNQEKENLPHIRSYVLDPQFVMQRMASYDERRQMFMNGPIYPSQQQQQQMLFRPPFIPYNFDPTVPMRSYQDNEFQNMDSMHPK